MPLATEYSAATAYAKFLKGKCKEECGCGGECDECKGCNECKDDCGCCPPGLVAVKDNEDNHVACLIFQCREGVVKAYDSDGDFVGCLSVTDYVAYKATLP